jgi:serine/threonine protein kinase
MEPDAGGEKLDLPGYECIEALGDGGMGQVFRARQKSLDREVAIKVLRADLPASGWLPERFEREALTMAALRHPNLVTVHDCLRLPDGRVAIVMELVRGGALRRHLASAPEGLPLASVLQWFREIAQGLRAAHEAGVVHRDIKPENILIDDTGHARVSDFGMAFSSHSDATRYTQTGVALGTVGYMAPEQLRGEAVDARADVFSLGVVLYEMLTGRLPQGSFSPARELRPEVPAALDRFIQSALRPDPGLRPAGMTAVLAMLRVLEGREPIPLFTRRHWIAASLAAGIAGACGAGWWFNRHRHDHPHTPAGSPSTPADGTAWKRIAWPEFPSAAAVSGGWRIENGWLISNDLICILPLVRQMPPAWDLRLRFRRLTGENSVEVFFRHPRGMASCLLDGWSNHVCGVQCLDGQTLLDRGGFTLPIVNERAYEWSLEFRPERVRMTVDGENEYVCDLGNAALTVARPWQWSPTPNAAALSIGSWKSSTRFEWVEWRPAQA